MCTVTVIIGQVGDGFAPIADYCKGTVFIVSQGNLQARSVAALKKRGLDINHLNVNFKKLGVLHKKVSIMRDDIQKDYGGISILINSATYNCSYDSKLSVHGQAKTLVYLNCLAVITISHILLPILRNDATVIYCTLKQDFQYILPVNFTNYNTIKLIMCQYLRAIKSGNYENEWGSSPYAVAKAGFTAMKICHKMILDRKGKKLIFDIDVDISLDPYNLYSRDSANCDNISFCVDKQHDNTNFEIVIPEANDVQNTNKNQNEPCINVADATALQLNVRKRARQDSTDQESLKKLCSHNISLENNQITPQTYLNVAICSKSKEITQDEANYIKEELNKAIISACIQPTDANIYPAFRNTPSFNEGVLKLWCRDDHTLSWLRNTVSAIKLPSNDELTVIDQKDVPGKLKVALFIPNFKDDISLLQKILIAQNGWCDMKFWNLCSVERTTIEEPFGVLLVLSIPEADVPKVMMRQRQISFMAGSVNIRFVTDAGFTDDPALVAGVGDSLGLVPVSNYEAASFPSLRYVFCCLDEFVPTASNVNEVWKEIV